LRLMVSSLLGWQRRNAAEVPADAIGRTKLFHAVTTTRVGYLGTSVPK
jgi:hypothetical protein